MADNILMAWIILASGGVFLASALLIALKTALHALALAKARENAERAAAFQKAQEGEPETRGLAIPDPAQLADALGKLIETLAKAPTWYAMFVGGFALLLLSASLVQPPAPAKAGASAASTPVKPGDGGTAAAKPQTVTTKTETNSVSTQSVTTGAAPATSAPAAPAGSADKPK